MTPATYRERLQAEGAALAVSGALGSAALLVALDSARENEWSTIGQLAAVAGLCAFFGTRSVRKWTRAAEVVDAAQGSGEPTPLWQLPAIAAALTLAISLPTGAWDAGLRVTGGCLLVGLTQSLLMASLVARAEQREKVHFVRLPGSRLGRGTRLGRLAR